jgi:hypothetical protein
MSTTTLILARLEAVQAERDALEEILEEIVRVQDETGDPWLAAAMAREKLESLR